MRIVPRTAIAATAAVFAAALLASCGGGSDASGSAGNGLEKTRLNVAGLAVVDDAPLYIARDKGLFKKQGLDVKVTTLTQSTQAIPGLLRGDIDIDAGGNYVSFLQAKSKGAIDLRILADGFHCAKDVLPILTMPTSPVKKPGDLTGKKVAVNIANNVQTMLLGAVLRSENVDPSKVKPVQVPFPDMSTALQKGQVDTVSAVEPFATDMSSRLKARKVLDSCTGPTENFPLSGVFATDKFVKDNPKTVAAFQRAYTEAQKMAADRSLVEAALPGYTKIGADTAKDIAIGTFPTALDAGTLQRVPDLMKASGLLSQPLNVQPLLVK